LLFFASFSKIENSAKNGQKVKAIYSLDGRVCNPRDYIHFKTWPGTIAKNAAQGPLVGIEPTALYSLAVLLFLALKKRQKSILKNFWKKDIALTWADIKKCDSF
jgi:hypothetical protein